MRQSLKLFLEEYENTIIFLIVLLIAFTVIVKIINRYVFYKRYVETEKSEQVVNPYNNLSLEARRLDKKVQYYLAHIILFPLCAFIVYWFIKFLFNFLETNLLRN